MAERGTILKFFPIHFIGWALVFLLTACSGGLLPFGPGSAGVSLDQGGYNPGIGSGAATGDEDEAANGGDSSNEDGDGGSTIVTSNIPLDSGVIGPPIYDHPGTPPQISGEIKILCKTNSLVKVQITGSARHDPPYDDEDFIDYEPNRTLRIHDEGDDKCLEVPLTAVENSTPQVPKNHFEAVFFTSLSFPNNLKFFLSQPDYKSEDSAKHDCGGSVVLQAQGRSFWTKLLAVGLFWQFDYESQLAEAPNCQIELTAEVTQKIP